jgi:hypothetical protein
MLWSSVAVVILAIGINKQLDLQTLVIRRSSALLAGTTLWASRRLIASIVLGLFLSGAWWAVGRAARAWRWQPAVAAGAVSALLCLGIAPETTGVLREMLFVDIHGAAGNIWQIQTKDVLEFSMASIVAMSCFSHHGSSDTSAHVPDPGSV